MDDLFESYAELLLETEWEEEARHGAIFGSYTLGKLREEAIVQETLRGDLFAGCTPEQAQELAQEMIALWFPDSALWFPERGSEEPV